MGRHSIIFVATSLLDLILVHFCPMQGYFWHFFKKILKIPVVLLFSKIASCDNSDAFLFGPMGQYAGFIKSWATPITEKLAKAHDWRK